MAKQKKMPVRQLNIRMPDELHRKVTKGAEKNGWPVNRELVRLLERAFMDEGVEALVRGTAKIVAEEVATNMAAQINDRIGDLARAYNAEITRAGERISQIEHVQRLHETIFNAKTEK